MAPENPPTVLLVDDEEMVLDTYRIWLEEDYDVRTATDGDRALDRMDGDVDVVLLDRRMPNASGDEALSAMREAGYDCKVAMVTAVDPDLDIVEMPFDAYLTKPVKHDDLEEVIERLTEVARHDDISQELFSVAHKRATLEAELDRTSLAGSDEYGQLAERHEELSERADAAVDSMDAETFETTVRDIGRGVDTE